MVAKFTREHPLASFFILAFAISWTLGMPAALVPAWPELLTFLAAFGPAAAAIILSGLAEGSDGILRLLSPLKKWQVGMRWYLVVLLGPALMMTSLVLLFELSGKGIEYPSSIKILATIADHLPTLAAIFIYQVVIIWGEEIGWRGYALPGLEKKYHPILASVILGVLWGLWHLPSFWIEGSVHQKMSVLFFVLATIGYSLLYTLIYNGTRGSLWIMCLLHAANNTTVSYTMLFYDSILEEQLVTLAVLGLFNLLVILLAGPKLLWHPSMAEERLSPSNPSRP